MGMGGILFPTKEGSVCKPVPGFKVKIVDDTGRNVAPNTFGNIVLGTKIKHTHST